MMLKALLLCAVLATVQSVPTIRPDDIPLDKRAWGPDLHCALSLDDTDGSVLMVQEFKLNISPDWNNAQLSNFWPNPGWAQGRGSFTDGGNRHCAWTLHVTMADQDTWPSDVAVTLRIDHHWSTNTPFGFQVGQVFVNGGELLDGQYSVGGLKCNQKSIPYNKNVGAVEAAQAAQRQVQVERRLPVNLDLGYLMLTDPNALDAQQFSEDREVTLRANARDGTQLLINAIFAQSIQSSSDGPLAQLPPPALMLPREKALPKPKPPTKWEKFARSKGITTKAKKDRLVFDEEKQDWVPSYGYKGKNKQTEDQWIVEVPNNADPSFDPVKASKDERKARKLKNEQQRLRNITRTATAPTTVAAAAAKEKQAIAASKALAGAKLDRPEQAARKRELESELATTKKSTASLGRYDTQLKGEGKVRGVKRKFEAATMPAGDEREKALTLLRDLSTKGPKRLGAGESTVNARKAINTASAGRGAASLVRSAEGRSSSARGRGRGRGRK
ncbi:uncharacterized protein L969DRAFT_94860 [Mixia osmundae IAM 14324]|uniref:Ribosome biogenesis regulatory protein n=1 Tax=Mixia osmundae (strain CBS 9802 / IAM 14324 / JCM 22182 / KY 12970) TaxID=764103 RepID=G7E1X0_MIXOS|nr:uncharacterized protein L969DRAFT_94860 [Mixia osmundae IAM 14324]KEI38660.1 hypothetical protein L969DRAFT_94860 [Mixia osmundae IAM 14324]GAA96883.1 hypothetical protein E5Q_03556 [Mixia osmundae IAM 14324]